MEILVPDAVMVLGATFGSIMGGVIAGSRLVVFDRILMTTVFCLGAALFVFGMAVDVSSFTAMPDAARGAIRLASLSNVRQVEMGIGLTFVVVALTIWVVARRRDLI